MAKLIAAAKSADEVREILTDPENVKALLKDPEEFVKWTNDSVQARLTSDPDILAQVRQQTEAFNIEFLRAAAANGDDLGVIAKRLNLDNPTARVRIPRNTIYNKAAIGAPHDGLFNTAAEFLHAISSHAHKDNALSNKLGTLQNALSSVKPSDGGFLIPEVLRAELLRVALEKAVVRSRARVIPMDSLTVPFPTVDATSNATSVFGGVTGFWTEEGATLTQSNPKFGRVELKANKLVLYTECPNELVRDSQPSLEAFIGEIFPEALAWFEDIAFFIGGGVGEPLGFLNAPATVYADRAGSSTDTVVWADVVNMYSRMLPSSLDRAIWTCSPDVLPQLLTMTVGSGNAAVWIGGGNFPSGADLPPMTMLGRPLVVTEKAKAMGTPGDLNFTDFGYYLIGDRQAMSARQSEDFKFNQDVTAYRVIERLDGRPWLQSAITPQNGSTNTLSPFVGLAD